MKYAVRPINQTDINPTDIRMHTLFNTESEAVTAAAKNRIYFFEIVKVHEYGNGKYLVYFPDSDSYMRHGDWTRRKDRAQQFSSMQAAVAAAESVDVKYIIELADEVDE